jgi:4-deoxy-L-threo-5-hexosulose-uronate ketol-isomerase
MIVLHAQSPQSAAHFGTSQLRDSFLISTLFAPGRVELHYWETDRTVIGSAVPGDMPLRLEASKKELAADSFLERREVGILNIGGAGHVEVDGVPFALGKLDCLYVGRNVRSVVFTSAEASDPARFYLLSYPAHRSYPTALVRQADATCVELGGGETANHRFLYKYIHREGIPSCQLVMGVTTMRPGSVWNTMPSHTHLRRSEVYLYFDMDPDHRVVHLMGQPSETRHLVIAPGEAVLSPVWSIHSGVGTSSYSFCWGMGGENQDFSDMDGFPIAELR